MGVLNKDFQRVVCRPGADTEMVLQKRPLMTLNPAIRYARMLLVGVSLVVSSGCGTVVPRPPQDIPSNLHHIKIFLAAADYRRAIEACQKEITERPSVKSYVYLTYVYQALDAYIDSLARSDRWVQVEQLARSLSSGRPDELLDSPDVLARIAKELIQDSSRKQSDIAAAMAARLDNDVVANLWSQQKHWREQKPDGWWFGVPPEWGW